VTTVTICGVCWALLFHGVVAGQSPAYRLDRIADGVFLAVPASPAPAVANIPIIVSDQDAILIGTHFSPASARALIEQVKTVTDKPVHFIVNALSRTTTPAPRGVSRGG
jgi:hypothetical protein